MIENDEYSSELVEFNEKVLMPSIYIHYLQLLYFTIHSAHNLTIDNECLSGTIQLNSGLIHISMLS